MRAAAGVNVALLADLYRTMVRIRVAEEKVCELYPTDKIQSPIHLSIGQEAVAAGLCRALRKGDSLYGTYRGHGLYLAKGADMRRLFAELYGKDTGCARGKGGSMHLAAPGVGLMGCSAIVASTIPVATGHALASKAHGRKGVVAAVFGDGGIDEGVFFESVNFAILKDLPVLYVLENNNYAIHSKVADRHKQTRLHRIAEGLGLSGRRFGGDDVETVYREARRAIERIAAGGPPMLLEFMTRRWYEHVGPRTDYQEKYREPGEQAKAEAGDPIRRAEAALLRRGWATGKLLERWRREAAAEVAAAVRYAEKSPFPGPERLLKDQYA